MAEEQHPASNLPSPQPVNIEARPPTRETFSRKPSKRKTANAKPSKGSTRAKPAKTKGTKIRDWTLIPGVAGLILTAVIAYCAIISVPSERWPWPFAHSDDNAPPKKEAQLDPPKIQPEPPIKSEPLPPLTPTPPQVDPPKVPHTSTPSGDVSGQTVPLPQPRPPRPHVFGYYWEVIPFQGDNGEVRWSWTKKKCNPHHLVMACHYPQEQRWRLPQYKY